MWWKLFKYRTIFHQMFVLLNDVGVKWEHFKNIMNEVYAFCIWIKILWSVGYYVNHLSYYWHLLKAQSLPAQVPAAGHCVQWQNLLCLAFPPTTCCRLNACWEPSRWFTTFLKLKKITPIQEMWTGMEGCSSRDEVLISRLRLGHTFLTHGYLMNNDVPNIAPICKLCNNAVMTIKHIMI